MPGTSRETAVSAITVRAAEIPTDAPESDGTFSWDRTGVVLVRIRAGAAEGLGYTYASLAAARVARDLAAVLHGRDVLDVPGCHLALRRAVRNAGGPGIAAMAISALDVALWDAKARTLGIALSTLLGRARGAVPLYGSGGFTSYSDARLAEQLAGWAGDGFGAVKMKVGREPDRDGLRVGVARQAVGAGVRIMVDANGALSRKQALAAARTFARAGVTWFEEPVSSDDLEGLRLLRDRGPAGLEIAAGEYGFAPDYFRRMLDAGAVDVLQADVTRCGGITGFLAAAALCDAAHLPLSAHCAPALHVAACCAAPAVRDLEWFHDHARIERLLFSGAPEPRRGTLSPDPARAGHGLELREAELERYEVRA